MIPWILLAVRAALAPNACLPISGERVLARDLARAVPAFAGLAPELVLGYAPGPGARRIFENAELDRLARRYGLAAEPGVAACFVRRLETLTNAGVTEALRAAWPGARIELVDFSRQPIPRGDLRFPVSGLRQDPAGSAPWLWRGAVRAPGQDDFPVWAKVRIEVSGTRVTAAEALTAGHPIARTQLREEPYLGPPGLPGLAQIVGRAPRRQIPAGAAIEAQWLDTPADILRGQRVRLEVRSGRMRLILEGEAQSSGSRGETIGVRNPANGKILRATVAAPGRAVLTADPGESASR